MSQINSGITEDQKPVLTAAVVKYRALIQSCPEERVLYHGDFGSNNLLVNDGKIVGVIDWDCAGIGDRLTDVAGAYFWSHHLECMKQQSAYFEKKLSHLPNYHKRIQCYQLKIGIEEIRENIEDGSTGEKIDWLFSRLNEVLQQSD